MIRFVQYNGKPDEPFYKLSIVMRTKVVPVEVQKAAEAFGLKHSLFGEARTAAEAIMSTSSEVAGVNISRVRVRGVAAVVRDDVPKASG